MHALGLDPVELSAPNKVIHGQRDKTARDIYDVEAERQAIPVQAMPFKSIHGGFI
jgi:hypothetical protein